MNVTKMLKVYKAARDCLVRMKREEQSFKNTFLCGDGRIKSELYISTDDHRWEYRGKIILDIGELEKRFNNAQEFLMYINAAIVDAYC